MSVAIQEKAPDFTLYSSERKEVTLSDVTDKNVVLLFFPLAFSHVCTSELRAIRDDIAAFNNLDARVVAISVDSAMVLQKLKEEEELNFTLLSDYNKEVSSLYGVLNPEFILGMKGVPRRSVFVIDQDQNIRYMEVLEEAGQLPDFQKVKETLQSLNE